jgi:hypothetical protein
VVAGALMGCPNSGALEYYKINVKLSHKALADRIKE